MEGFRARELEHCRAVLKRVLNRHTVAELDFQQFPDAKTTGEILLHIAGFEFVMVSGAELLRGGEPDHALWKRLKPGFGREAGFPPPRSMTLADYFDLLDIVQQRTLAFFSDAAGDERNVVSTADFPISRLARMLAAKEDPADAAAYERLAAGVGTSFRDDGADIGGGRTDLILLLQLHETYHRGQITLQKYIYRRLH